MQKKLLAQAESETTRPRASLTNAEDEVNRLKETARLQGSLANEEGKATK